MDSDKIIVTPDSGSSSALSTIGALAPFLQNKGLDSSALYALMNNGNLSNNPIWLIFLMMMYGGYGGYGNGFGGGFGGNGAGFLANQLTNTAGRDYLMDAIQGNATAIGNLATALNTSTQQVQAGLNSLSSIVQGVGNQVGMSGLQVINALQACDANIAQQIANAAAASQLGICQQTNALQGSICDAKTQINQSLTGLGFQTERQTCTITNAIKDSTQRIVDGQRDAEIRELNGIITSQRTELAELRTAASTQQIIAQALIPIQQSIAALQTGGGTTVTKATAGA